MEILMHPLTLLLLGVLFSVLGFYFVTLIRVIKVQATTNAILDYLVTDYKQEKEENKKFRENYTILRAEHNIIHAKTKED